MGLFSIGNMLLKYKRSKLPREVLKHILTYYWLTLFIGGRTMAGGNWSLFVCSFGFRRKLDEQRQCLQIFLILFCCYSICNRNYVHASHSLESIRSLLSV